MKTLTKAATHPKVAAEQAKLAELEAKLRDTKEMRAAAAAAKSDGKLTALALAGNDAALSKALEKAALDEVKGAALESHIQAAVEQQRAAVEAALKEAKAELAAQFAPEHARLLKGVIDALQQTVDAYQAYLDFDHAAHSALGGMDASGNLHQNRLDPLFWGRVQYVANEWSKIVQPYIEKRLAKRGAA